MGRKKHERDREGKRHRRVPPAAIAVLAASAAIAAGVSMRVTAKAGYPAALGLLALVSPLNLMLGIAFALTEWPIERELREARGPASG